MAIIGSSCTPAVSIRDARNAKMAEEWIDTRCLVYGYTLQEASVFGTPTQILPP